MNAYNKNEHLLPLSFYSSQATGTKGQHRYSCRPYSASAAASLEGGWADTGKLVAWKHGGMRGRRTAQPRKSHHHAYSYRNQRVAAAHSSIKWLIISIIHPFSIYSHQSHNDRHVQDEIDA